MSAEASPLQNARLSADTQGGPGYSPGTDPFYIQSRIDSSNWVLSIHKMGNPGVLGLRRKAGDFGQLWTRVESNIPGAFYLVNLKWGWRLKAAGMQGGAAILAQWADDSDANFLWKLDGPHGPERHVFLTMYRDWQQKLNCAGNGPYDEDTRICLWEYSHGQQNELWYFVADSKDYRVDRIEYDLKNSRLEASESRGASKEVDNRHGKGLVETTIELSRRVVETASFTSTETHERTIAITNTLGISMSVSTIPTVATATASYNLSVEVRDTKTTTLTQTNTSSIDREDKLSVKVTVLPGVATAYHVLARYGTVVVPYTAYISRQLPNGTRSAPVATRGEFRGTNSVDYKIIGVDPDRPDEKPKVIAESQK